MSYSKNAAKAKPSSDKDLREAEYKEKRALADEECKCTVLRWVAEYRSGMAIAKLFK